MNKVKNSTVIIMILLMTILFTACSSSKNAKMDMAVTASYNGEYYQEAETKASSDDLSSGLTGTTGLTSTSGLTVGNTDNHSMDKIITRVNLEVETQDFDNLITTIKEQITKLGGYDEKTEISGRRYYSRNTSRYGHIIARVPKNKLNEFVELVKVQGNVINESSTSENVTLKYVDTQSRKKSLEIEQERLFALLEKTETLEDIVTLESRLSSIRHELQMYETELRTIDNQVEYSTVTLSIYEVERITPREEKETVITRIKNGFSQTIYDLSEGFKNFIVWFVVNLPYLIIWALVITGGFVIITKLYRKYKNKKEDIKKIAEKFIEEEAKE